MIGAYLVLKYFRKKYEEGVSWITGTELEDGNIDLHPSPEKLKFLIIPSLILKLVTFITLLFTYSKYIGNSNSINDIFIPLIIFTICAVADGILIGCILILSNEHLASKALKITIFAVAITMLLSCKLGINFSFLGPILLISLTGLLILQIVRIFKSFSKKSERKITLFGVIIFISYLLFDFSIIMNNENIYSQDWGAALNLAIDIYLDVINLFLYILEFLGD